MASLKTDEVNLRVVIDGTPARKELANLDQAMVATRDRIKELESERDRLNKTMKEAPKYSEEWKQAQKGYAEAVKGITELNAEMKQSRERASELRKEIGTDALSVRELRNEAAKLRILRDTASGGSQAFHQFDAQLTEVNNRIRLLTNDSAKHAAAWEAVRGQYKLSEMSMRELEMEAKRLRTALETMRPTDPGFAKLRADLQATERQMEATRTGLGPFAQAWHRVRGSVVGTFAGMTAVFASGSIINGLKGWVTNAAKLSDAQAEVARTTGLTKAQTDSLTKSLSQLNTRTARSELLALAKDAGKLGISAEKDVLSFVSAGDKINVALGEELGEGAIEQLGKLTQTFKVTERNGYDLGKSLLASGSAINDLANASTASGAFLVDYATRLGGVNTQAGISIENTLGYGAALDQLGQRSETASTAISTFTVGAFKDTAEYAKIAGMSVGDFTKLLNTDTNEALLRVLKGLNGNKDGLAAMAVKFKDMGQEGARAVGVLSSLASNTDLIGKQQEIANKSFAEGTSVIEAFNRKNSTLGANLDIIGKKLAGAFVNSGVVKGINSIVSAVADWMRVPVSAKLEEERMALRTTEAQILSYNVGNQERTKLIRELQAQYPGFLANVNAETVSQDQLRQAVGRLNQELVNKILLQKQDEKIQAQIRDQAERKQAVLDREDDVRERMVKLAERYNLQIRDGVPLLQQAAAIEQLVQDIRTRTGVVTKGQLVDSFARYQHAIAELSAAYGFLNTEEDRSNQLAREREDLMKRLGISTAAAPSATQQPATTTEAPDLASDDAEQEKRDAALKAMKQLREDLLKLRRQMELDGMSADEREIAQLDDKYKEIHEKILANTQHTAEDVATWEDTYEDARAELLTKQAEERAAKVAAAKLKATQEATQAEDAYWLGQMGEEDQAITREMQRMDELVALYDKAGWDTQQIVERTEKAVQAIRDKYRVIEEQKRIDAEKKAIEEKFKTYQAVAGALGGVNDLLSASYAAMGDANYEYTNAAKVLGLAQIAISSGVGVAKAIEAGAGMVWPANLAAIASGVAAVLSGIAQATALLSKASYSHMSHQSEGPGAGSTAPSINNAPIGADGMVLSGPSHREKGLAVINAKTGKQEAELEGGELVMSKAFTEANADQLPALLALSKAGARLNFLTEPLPRINVGAYRQAERAVRMADGGILGSGALLNAIASSAIATPDTGLAHEMRVISSKLDKLDKLDDLITVSARQKDAVLRLGPDTDQTFDDWQKLKDRNTIRRA